MFQEDTAQCLAVSSTCLTPRHRSAVGGRQGPAEASTAPPPTAATTDAAVGWAPGQGRGAPDAGRRRERPVRAARSTSPDVRDRRLSSTTDSRSVDRRHPRSGRARAPKPPPSPRTVTDQSTPVSVTVWPSHSTAGADSMLSSRGCAPLGVDAQSGRTEWWATTARSSASGPSVARSSAGSRSRVPARRAQPPRGRRGREPPRLRTHRQLLSRSAPGRPARTAEHRDRSRPAPRREDLGPCGRWSGSSRPPRGGPVVRSSSALGPLWTPGSRRNRAGRGASAPRAATASGSRPQVGRKIERPHR